MKKQAMKLKHVLIRHGSPTPHTEYKIAFTFWSYVCHKLLHLFDSPTKMHKNGSKLETIDW